MARPAEVNPPPPSRSFRAFMFPPPLLLRLLFKFGRRPELAVAGITDEPFKFIDPRSPKAPRPLSVEVKLLARTGH